MPIDPNAVQWDSPKIDPAAVNWDSPSSVKQGAADLMGGLVRGAGSIGATILYPIDKATDLIKGDRTTSLSDLVTGKKPLSRNEERRQDMDSALTDLIGSDPNSLLYKGGKLGGEIAGTAGVGGVAANALRLAPGVAAAAPNLLRAIETGGMSANGANLLTRAAGGAINGGLSAGLVDPSQAVEGAAIGAALPPALKGAGALGKAAAGAIAGKVAPEVQALAKRAADLGIQVPADRIANSKPLNAAAASLNYVPFSGRAAVEKRMQDQLDTALSRTFGQDSSNVTQALRKAQTDLGGKFDTVLKGNTVNVDRQLLSDIGDVSASASRELGSDGLRAINGQIDELVSKGANGAIDGQAAYNVKRALDRIGSRNTPEAFHARELKKALMGALDRSLGPEEAAAFAQTRKQYGNMLALEGLAQNGAEGGLSMARVANMKNINNPDLQELADIAAQFLKPREGMHGSWQRAAIGGGLAASAGVPALVGGALGGRAGNALLDSNAMRNMLLRDPNAPNALAQLAERAAPAVRAAPVALSRD